MQYSYYCQECGTEFTSPWHGDRAFCPMEHLAHRIWRFGTSFPDQDHFNISAGRHITSRHALSEHAKRESERATLRTGIPHDFQVVDHFDREALHVDQTGINHIADAHPDQPNYVRPLE